MITLHEARILNEARDPAKKYSEKMVKSKLERVILELDGSDAATITRLARRWNRLVKAIELMKVQSDKLKEDLRGKMDEMFDAEDVVITRVLATATVTITYAKKPEPTEPNVVKDWEKIAADIAKLVSSDLLPQIEAIEAMYSSIEPPSTKKAGLSIKVEEGLMDGTKRFIAGIVKKYRALQKKVLSWAVGYDKELEDLHRRLKALDVKHAMGG